MAVISKGTIFPAELATEMFSQVKGKSSLAALSQQIPIAFTGTDIFTFSMDAEVNLAGENEANSEGGAKVTPVKMMPVKIEYGARVSEEFMTASEEKQIEILQAFNEGFAKKVGRGLDIMAMHGLNPRTGTASALITQHFDKGSLTVTYTAVDPDANVEEAVAAIGEADMTGIAMAKTMSADMAKLTNGKDGPKKYPELAWGGQPNVINGVPASVNTTVSFGSTTKDVAIIGDFANCFKWGYSKQIPVEVIPYGDPDNTGKDLKGQGQVYLRAQAYIGWGILNEKAFARIVTA